MADLSAISWFKKYQPKTVDEYVFENEDQKNQIMSAANESSRQITQGAREYADSILENLAKSLEKTLKEIEDDRKELK